MQIQATCSSNPATARGACRPIICLHCSILMRKVTGRQSMKPPYTQRGPQTAQICQHYCSFDGVWWIEDIAPQILNLGSKHLGGQLLQVTKSLRYGLEASPPTGIRKTFLRTSSHEASHYIDNDIRAPL